MRMNNKKSTRARTWEYGKRLVSCKRSQEEMVGFVLIVVLVTIIALVFLAISLRQAPASLDNKEITSFMQSAMRYSSDCYPSKEIRYDLKDLIKACYNDERCLNGTLACDMLNKTAAGIMRESWKVGNETPVKSYTFKAYKKEMNETIIRLKDGNCTGSISGSSISISNGIEVELEICR